MLKKEILLLVISTGVFLSCPTSAEIYKWIDENGEVVFSERKPNRSEGEFEEVKPRTAPASTADEPNEDNAAEAETTPEDKPPLTTEQEKQIKEQAAKDAEIAKQNCASAKRRHIQLQRPRINQLLPDGGRRSMGEDERQTEIANAEQAMSEWCK
ncbi:MAG: DUF4124 domain-containing protein [Pseudomonadota bacterium]